MGERAWWRRHPWWCAGIGSTLLIAAALVALAVNVHRRGLQLLDETIARQRAQSHGGTVLDLAGELPPRDAEQQRRAWQLATSLAGSSTPTTVDLVTSICHQGVAWKPGADLLERYATRPSTVEQLRAILRSGRVLLSAGAGRLDGQTRDDQRLAHRAHIVWVHWLMLSALCGDAEAQADLERAPHVLGAGGSLIDLMGAWEARELADRTQLYLAVVGSLDQPSWGSWGAGPDAVAAELSAAIHVERLTLATDARSLLDGELHGTTLELVADRWLHGASDIASSLDALLELERGRTPAVPERSRLRLRSGLSAEEWIESFASIRTLGEEMRRRGRVARAAAALAILGRAGELPATLAEGPPALRAFADELPRIDYQRLSATRFTVSSIMSTKPRQHAERIEFEGGGVVIDLDPSPVP